MGILGDLSETTQVPYWVKSPAQPDWDPSFPHVAPEAAQELKEKKLSTVEELILLPKRRKPPSSHSPLAQANNGPVLFSSNFTCISFILLIEHVSFGKGKHHIHKLQVLGNPACTEYLHVCKEQ